MGLIQSKLAVGDLIFDARLLAENPFRFHPLLASDLSGTVLIVFKIRRWCDRLPIYSAVLL